MTNQLSRIIILINEGEIYKGNQRDKYLGNNTDEMLGMFKQTKTKCMLIMRQLRIDETELESYKKVQKLFALDMNLLGYQHLIQRKNKLMEAIDSIMKLQTTLSIRKARQIPQIDEQQEQESSNSTRKGFQQFNNFAQLIKKESKPEKPKMKQNIIETKVNVRSIEDQKRFNQVIGRLKFNNTELTSIWTKNKPSIDQTTEDKFDRISRTLGALRKNGRTMYQQERLKTSCINFLDYSEFNKVLTQLQRIKMQNEQLRSQIIRLIQQNESLKSSQSHTILKVNKQISRQYKESQIQTDIQQSLYQQIIVQNQKFKIVKYYKQELQLDSFILERKNMKHLEMEQSCILKGLNNDIGDSVIECIVDPQLQKNESFEYLSASNRLNTYQEQPFSGLLSFNKRIKTEFNPENILRSDLILGSAIESKDLNSVENKLKQIRENRKKIINDDDLWSQVENMKM